MASEALLHLHISPYQCMPDFSHTFLFLHISLAFASVHLPILSSYVVVTEDYCVRLHWFQSLRHRVYCYMLLSFRLQEIVRIRRHKKTIVTTILLLISCHFWSRNWILLSIQSSVLAVFAWSSWLRNFYIVRARSERYAACVLRTLDNPKLSLACDRCWQIPIIVYVKANQSYLDNSGLGV